jgi:hypothetical protein
MHSNTAQLQRTTFRTSRVLDFFSEKKELVAQTGHQAAEDASIDQDITALQAEAARLLAEAAAVNNVKRLSVPISKAASALLAREIERRPELGHCELLTEQAIRQAFGGQQ